MEKHLQEIQEFASRITRIEAPQNPNEDTLNNLKDSITNFIGSVNIEAGPTWFHGCSKQQVLNEFIHQLQDYIYNLNCAVNEDLKAPDYFVEQGNYLLMFIDYFQN